MPAEKPEEPSLSDSQVLRKNLLRLGRETALSNWKPILTAVAGYILGVATLKIDLAAALSTARDAKEATTELRAAIKDLATERELQDTNRRMDDVVAFLTHAQKVSEEPPPARRHRK